ncbi:MAG: SMP-30/gluconolactonase/LRE family protein [Acidobacteria bacterium]|nr:MAG: SMP-30/gluconolactonase/LRE family protein [Acidobacteriota bacterium]
MNKLSILTLALTISMLAASAQDQAVVAAIEKFDPELDHLLTTTTPVEQLATGFLLSEGPVWSQSRRCLLFSDVAKNAIYEWAPSRGLATYLTPSGYDGPPTSGLPGSNGLTLDQRDRLIICQQGERRVVRLEEDGTFTVLASHYLGKRLNSPNDLVFASNGDLYFTDPPYGLPKGNSDPAKELKFNGVYRLTAGGELSLLTSQVSYPNGIALSPDEETLYVSNSDPKRAVWLAFGIGPDGKLGTGRVIQDVTGLSPGLPDGIKVDRNGYLFTAGPGGIYIIAPDGRFLGRIRTGESANCAWGENGSVLYITAGDRLCRIQTTTQGAGWSRRYSSSQRRRTTRRSSAN